MAAPYVGAYWFVHSVPMFSQLLVFSSARNPRMHASATRCFTSASIGGPSCSNSSVRIIDRRPNDVGARLQLVEKYSVHVPSFDEPSLFCMLAHRSRIASSRLRT